MALSAGSLTLFFDADGVRSVEARHDRDDVIVRSSESALSLMPELAALPFASPLTLPGRFGVLRSYRRTEILVREIAFYLEVGDQRAWKLHFAATPAQLRAMPASLDEAITVLIARQIGCLRSSVRVWCVRPSRDLRVDDTVRFECYGSAGPRVH